MKNALLDIDFLKKLDSTRHKTIYAKIISLTVEEYPREEITGKVQSGSINIDGASAVRRTCSLTLIANDVNLNSFYWGLNTKFKLYIGVKNEIDNRYEDIIWFPQGVYVISAFSSSQSANTYNINISGKDKMCLLNGEMGGKFQALTTVLHEMDRKEKRIVNNKEEEFIFTEKLTLKSIIYKLVSELGGEKISNIIINNLDDYGLELMKYSSLTPMYLFIDSRNEPYQIYLDDQVKVDIVDGEKGKTLADLSLEDSGFQWNTLIEIDTKSINQNGGPTKVILTDNPEEEYTIAKIIDGQTVGYRLTDLTFAGELIMNAGENIAGALDKIKNQLGDFEYFYDIDGRFIFQRAENYVNVSWKPVIEQVDENSGTKVTYVTPNVYASKYSYNFSGNELITSLNNNPNIMGIRNDFTVWGTRKSVTGNELPIHMRFALDKKPTSYVSLEITEDMVKNYNAKYGASLQKQSSKKYTVEEYDWREIIYQMAKDYRKYNGIDDFNGYIYKYNPQYVGGITGYEDYYTDLEGFWRQLYNPEPNAEEMENYYSKTYWHKNVIEDPSALNFWFDIMEESEGDIMKFSVPAIGRRKEVKNDSDVKSLYFPTVPNIIFYTQDSDLNKKEGYSYFPIKNNLERYFDLSSQKKSAAEVIDELFYQNIYAQETISLSTIPIYYLQPNTIIYVKDDKNLDINGEYSITRMTIPLTHNGTMSISATKIIKK